MSYQKKWGICIKYNMSHQLKYLKELLLANLASFFFMQVMCSGFLPFFCSAANMLTMCIIAHGMFWFVLFFCQEQWKTSSNTPGKRKDRSKTEDEEVGNKKRRRKGIRRKDQKTKMQYGEEEDEYKDEPEADDDYADLARYNGADNSERAPDHLLAAAGLDDSDAEDDMVRTVLFFINNYIQHFLCTFYHICSFFYLRKIEFQLLVVCSQNSCQI